MKNSNHHHLIWKRTGKTLIRDFRIFKACEIESISPDGERAVFVQLDSPDWVNVVSVVNNELGEECFVMVRQFRHGSESLTLEFPAGLVDPGEDLVKAAEREFLEETGYKADSFRLIGSANPDPAFMNNTSYTYFAENPKPGNMQSLDQHEIIDIELVPVSVFEKEMGSGEFINAITILAYTWYRQLLAHTGNRE